MKERALPREVRGRPRFDGRLRAAGGSGREV